MIVALGLANAWFTGWTIAELIAYPTPVDWRVLTTAAHLISHGRDPYAFAFGDGSFRWSPLIAWLFVPISAAGPYVWAFAHVAVLALVPNRRLAVLVLLSWPFWFDLATGNVMTFVFVAALWALRGHRVASILVLGLAMLVPRPLMIPLVVWLLWKQPWTRPVALGLVALHLAGLALVGWTAAWLVRLGEVAPSQIGTPFDVGPARLVGALWAPIGLVMAAVLLWRGRVGWASLAASPYWLPYYLFMPLLELDRAQWRPWPPASVPLERGGA